MVNNLLIDGDIQWKISSEPVPYPDALSFMEKRVNDIINGCASECVWLLEHPPLYTAGTSAQTSDLLFPDRFPVFKTGRGGEYTYHGPGQRVAYVMLDLNRRRKDVRWFVRELEGWIIDVCARFDIKAERREGRVGLWVVRDGESEGGIGQREEKIAALGIRLRRWVSFHGVSINIAPDLEHFSGIVPCGIAEHGVTSFSDLGKELSYEALDLGLREEFQKHF